MLRRSLPHSTVTWPELNNYDKKGRIGQCGKGGGVASWVRGVGRRNGDSMATSAAITAHQTAQQDVTDFTDRTHSFVFLFLGLASPENWSPHRVHAP